MKRLLVVFYILIIGSSAFAQSDSEKEAKWILERITGVRWPSDAPVLQQINVLVASKNQAGAVQLAMMQPQFYNITVKQLAVQMSTREETIRTPFNDFAAAFIGVTRDDLDARQLLTGNFYYSADALVPVGVDVPRVVGPDIVASNRHYAALESNRLNLGDVLEKRDGQLLVVNNANTTVANPDAAGVLTSRAYIEAHATAGTNRRLVEFAFRQFMCASIDQIADTMAPDIRIGRDIDRFPGGDHTKFQTTCKGCHTVMDGFRGAFAKWDFNGAALHSSVNGIENRDADNDANGVMNKLNKNGTVYPGGYVTRDDSWVNHANRGANALSLGWRGTASTGGTGVAGFGNLLANSQRFSQCMAKRVFQTICRRDISDDAQKLIFTQIGTQWESANYRFKKLFEIVTTHPECRYKEAL